MLKRVILILFLLQFFFLNGLYLSAHSDCILFSQNYKISGVIKDSLSHEVLPMANIGLVNPADSQIVAGAISNDLGQFVMENIPAGQYFLRVRYAGYIEKYEMLIVDAKDLHLEIWLSPFIANQTAIEIIGQRQMVERSIEKTTVNVDQNIISTGGTALDVLQNIQSIDVDEDGKISYRGSNKVRVLINGAASVLSENLSQISADQIEKVELINNPSAKYDAEGVSGIINIVLKSSTKKTKKTTFKISGGYPENASLAFSFFNSKDRFVYNIGLNYSLLTRFQTKEHLRSNFGNLLSNDFYQFDRQDEVLNNGVISSGIEYSTKNNGKVGADFLISSKLNKADRHIDYQTLTSANLLVYQADKAIDIAQNNFSLGGHVFYANSFDKNRLKMRADISAGYLNGENGMQNQTFDAQHVSNPVAQNTVSSQTNKEFTSKLDFSKIFCDSLGLDFGGSFNLLDLTNDFRVEDFSYLTNLWSPNSQLSQKFNFRQHVSSVYFDLNRKYKNAEWIAGLRFEHTTTFTDAVLSQTYLDWFPSLNFNRRLSKHFILVVAASRRISRPTIKMLNPFSDEYADITNMHIGNPKLRPEYILSGELGFRFISKMLTTMMLGYYRDIDDAISRVKFASNDSALTVTFSNLSRAQMFGAEWVGELSLKKWLKINYGINLFNIRIIGDYGSNSVDKKLPSFHLNSSVSFKLPHRVTIQVSGFYRSKLPSLLGTYIPRYMVDFAVKKSIWKNKAVVTLKISDVLNMYRYGFDLNAIDDFGFDYSQWNRRKNESQYFILSFTYNMNGSEKAKTNKKAQFFLDEFEK
ncbi:MAG: TonB-dependent receptor [Bacteroidales bacterium]|nr:TonB-dependent receptor [Bacteroidales bacterium]